MVSSDDPRPQYGEKAVSQSECEPWIDTVSKALYEGASRRKVLGLMARGAAGSFMAMLGIGMAGCVRTDDHLKPSVISAEGNTAETAACPSCGTCVHCTYDAATGDGACVPCAEQCLTNVACTAANRDEKYRMLADYLVAQDYQAHTQPDSAGGVAPVTVHAVETLLLQVGDEQRPVTRLQYTHAQQSARRAILYYAQLGTDEAQAAAVRFDGDTFTDMVYVNDQGQVTTAQPDPSRTPKPPPLIAELMHPMQAGSLAGLSELAFTMPQQPAHFASEGFQNGLCHLTCEVLGNVPKADCGAFLGAVCVGALTLGPAGVVCLLAMAYLCQELGDHLGPPLQNWCMNHICCSGCDDNCEICLNGQCVAKCSDGYVCCDGTCEPAPAAQVDKCGGSCLWCSCNGKTYTSTEQCQSECHVGLGCFTAICQPAPCPAVS